MMSDAELNELAKDIKEHGLQHSVLLLRIGTKHSVLDGRNRLEALARLGVEFVADPIHVDVPPRSAAAIVFETIEVKDPATFVISANIRRRHLTKEQQAELVAKTVEAGRAKNDSAKVARSFSPTTGRKGRSTQGSRARQGRGDREATRHQQADGGTCVREGARHGHGATEADAEQLADADDVPDEARGYGRGLAGIGQGHRQLRQNTLAARGEQRGSLA